VVLCDLCQQTDQVFPTNTVVLGELPDKSRHHVVKRACGPQTYKTGEGLLLGRAVSLGGDPKEIGPANDDEEKEPFVNGARSMHRAPQP
jgi:hypothetical protein